MRISTLVLGFSIAAIAAVTGCTPEGQAFCEALVKERCKFAYQCCNGQERNALGLGNGHITEATCVEEGVLTCGGQFAALDDGQETGRLELDGAQLDTCLKDTRAASGSCDAEAFFDPDLTDACNIGQAVNGLVDDGDRCFISAECKDEGAFCEGLEADEGEVLFTAKGECKSPPDTGDECPDFICAPDNFCNFDNPPTCEAQGDVGDDCTGDAECKSGLCDFIDGTCQNPFANGTECNFSGECESGFCDFDQNPPECANNDPVVVFDICLADEQ